MDWDFDWLPELPDWQALLDEAKALPSTQALARYRLLANSRMDFACTVKLDRAVEKHFARETIDMPSVRLALLGSSTLTHLLPGIRIGGLRRNLRIEIYEAPYGVYWQELADNTSGLHRFRPEILLLALDAHHLTAEGASAQRALERMRSCWRMAGEAFPCAVVQQAVLPVFPPLLGNNEHRLAESPATVIEKINTGLRTCAAEEGVSLLALDVFARLDGLRAWHDPGLWLRAKQEVHPRASTVYGDQVGRLLAAIRGLSRKCLVLDLDNTLWGGVIGDDGLEGLTLGQGSAAGEAYLELQRYAKRLAERGVILAVCSKNDEVNALVPFSEHPEMLLMRADIACFVANWQDKATNLRAIAATLRIGLDSLVFVDDNPAERDLVRRELPEVAVPEMPDDAAEFVRVLSGAGYFEALTITEEDRARGVFYGENVVRHGEFRGENTTDIASFLAGLRMELLWRPFDAPGRARITQLINKTNQFNLTTTRCVEADVDRLMARDEVMALQFRLKDAHGDNGMIGVLICEPTGADGADLTISTWLMSCRVLGRQVEHAMMNVAVEQARRRGAARIFGRYLPTSKNGIVRCLYASMGFELLEKEVSGATRWALDVATYQVVATQITITPAEPPKA